MGKEVGGVEGIAEEEAICSRSDGTRARRTEPITRKTESSVSTERRVLRTEHSGSLENKKCEIKYMNYNFSVFISFLCILNSPSYVVLLLTLDSTDIKNPTFEIIVVLVIGVYFFLRHILSVFQSTEQSANDIHIFFENQDKKIEISFGSVSRSFSNLQPPPQPLDHEDIDA